MSSESWDSVHRQGRSVPDPNSLNRLPTERPAAGAFTATESETGDPHHGEHDGRNPQQVNGKSCAEENEYQKS